MNVFIVFAYLLLPLTIWGAWRIAPPAGRGLIISAIVFTVLLSMSSEANKHVVRNALRIVVLTMMGAPPLDEIRQYLR